MKNNSIKCENVNMRFTFYRYIKAADTVHKKQLIECTVYKIYFIFTPSVKNAQFRDLCFLNINVKVTLQVLK